MGGERLVGREVLRVAKSAIHAGGFGARVVGIVDDFGLKGHRRDWGTELRFPVMREDQVLQEQKLGFGAGLRRFGPDAAVEH